ncbi:hypothetical protein [Phocaeicola vulgatus]|uniref:hypothetical protein n=1 Tax=Phocaeicola vulgatus TaxID=821 RepID=UPI00211EDDEC|nr:hypothetical protein [Phocaeicola vulgatus]
MRRPLYVRSDSFLPGHICRWGSHSEEMWGFSKEEEMQFLASHGKAVSRMVASIPFCRGPFSRRVLLRPVGMAHKELHGTALSGGCDQAFCQPDVVPTPFIYLCIRSAERGRIDELETEPKKRRGVKEPL